MFWENFVSLCAERGISPNAVAAELSLSSGSVTAWKGGTVPRETTLRKIANYFGVSVDYLIGFDKKENPTVSGEVDIKAWLNGRSDSELLQIIAEATRMMQEKK